METYLGNLSLILILLLLLSIYAQSAEGFSGYNTMSLQRVPNTRFTMIKLPDNITRYTNCSIIVTVLSNDIEIPLPYIYVPREVENISYVVDYMYNNRRLSSMSSEELASLLKKIMEGKIVSQLVRPISISYSVLVKDKSLGIIAVLPREKIAPSSPTYRGWYREALRLGYKHRLMYLFNNYVLYVYYKLNRSSSNGYELPILSPSTTIYVKDYMIENHNRGTKIISQKTFSINMIQLRRSFSAINRAIFVKEEEYHGINKELNKYGDPGLYIWYIMPWNKTHWDPYNEKLILSRMANSTFTGNYYYELSDSFEVLENTTRYELWGWIQSDKDVSFTLKIKLDDTEAFNEYITLHKNVLFGVGIIVHTTEEPGSYLTPKTTHVEMIMNGVNDSSATIGVHAIINGRSYVGVSKREDYYRSYNYMNGVGEIYGSSPYPDQSLDRRYEYVFRGEYIGYLQSPIVIYESYDEYPFYYYPYIYLRVESSDDQLYNRYVDVIINGNLVAHIKTSSNVQDGIPGKRYAYIAVSNDVFESILSSMRLGKTIEVIVRIEDYDPAIDSDWYLSYGYLAWLSRPVAAQIGYSSKDFDPIDYQRHTISIMPVYDYSGVELFDGENSVISDVVEYSLQIISSPIVADYSVMLGLFIDLKYGAKPVYNNYLVEGAWIGKIMISAKIKSSHELTINDPSIGYVSGGTRRKEMYESIAFGLWVTQMGLSIVSLFGSSMILGAVALGSNIMSYPGFYVYGEVYSTSYEQLDPYTYVFTIVYDPGWILASRRTISLYPKIMPIGPWSDSDYVVVTYNYKIYLTYKTIDTRSPGSIYERAGYISDEGTFYIYPAK